MPGELSALLATICYALSNMFLRKGQENTLPADNGLFPILAIGGVILTVNLIFDGIDDPAPLLIGESWLKNVVFCMSAGIVGTFLGRLALYAAIRRIGAIRGIIFIAMAPVVTLMIAISVLGERLTLLDVIGIALLASGIAILVVEGIAYSDRNMFSKVVHSGIVVAVVATLCQGIGYSFRKLGSGIPIDPIFAAALDTLAALFGYVLVLALMGKLRFYIRYYSTHINLWLVASGFLNAAAVFLFFEAVSETNVSVVSMITGSQPVVIALLCGVFMRDLERLTRFTIMSSIFVTFGVVMLGLK
ncbi:hypothetical protein AAC03nite_00910 [Alicyclobacillus acidoterrestris]|nr:hypothetical protein AAC03nite_00910 [Alicyclobacillus acidoterrestris]